MVTNKYIWINRDILNLIELPYWHYKDAEEYLNKFLKKTLDKVTN